MAVGLAITARRTPTANSPCGTDQYSAGERVGETGRRKDYERRVNLSTHRAYPDFSLTAAGAPSPSDRLVAAVVLAKRQPHEVVSIALHRIGNRANNSQTHPVRARGGVMVANVNP